MKRLKVFIVKVAEFGNPSTKNIDRGTLLCVLKYFKSNETQSVVNFVQKNLFLNLYALWWIFHASYIPGGGGTPICRWISSACQ